MTKALISGFTKSLEELFYVLESQFTPKTTTKEDIIAKTRKYARFTRIKWKTSYLVLKTVCTERTKESHEKQQGTAKEGKSFSVTNGRQDKTVGEKSQEAYF